MSNLSKARLRSIGMGVTLAGLTLAIVTLISKAAPLSGHDSEA
ncbi:MAG: hypothetical protein ACR2OD_06025 [Gaiellaceae bacterium]